MSGLDFVVTGAAGVGPQQPAPSTPDRAAGSMRRTSSLDVVRADGPAGAVRVQGRARDLATGADGSARVVADRALDATLAPTLELRTITTAPGDPTLEALVGRTVASGFRGAAVAAVPGARAAADLLYLLLDDLPVATLVSGYALQRAGLVPGIPRERFAPTIDLCAGWQSGGTLMQVVETNGMPPMTLGPPAPLLLRDDDPDAWHALPDPAPRTVRRRRRIDVVREHDPDTLLVDALLVDAMFRDSHFDDDLTESVVHEYSLPRHHRCSDADHHRCGGDATRAALHRVPERGCDATRLVGSTLDVVRDRVRSEFVGTSTCTHLNDLLRSLEDVRGMHAGCV